MLPTLHSRSPKVPPEGLAVEGDVLKVASGTVFVAEATTCTLMAEDGVVTNLEGLPSKPVEFGSYIFQMKDSVPPAIISFLPSAGAGSVHLAFSDAQTVSFFRSRGCLWQALKKSCRSQNCRRYFHGGRLHQSTWTARRDRRLHSAAASQCPVVRG